MSADTFDPFDGVVEAAFREWLIARAKRIAESRVEHGDDDAVGWHVRPDVAKRIDAELDEMSDGAAKIALRGALVEIAERYVDEIEREVEIVWWKNGAAMTATYSPDLPDDEIAARLRGIADALVGEETDA